MNLAANIDFISVISNGAINQMSSPMDEVNLITQGLTVSGLLKFIRAMEWDSNTVARVFRTTKRTLDHHVKNKKLLSMSISENAVDVARITTIGAAYFGSIERWKKWLETPHVQFGKEPPETVLHALRGRELIKRIILGLEYGFAT
tara:strand:- start:3548 stop:3985 length:438 start_codon:yes stop_codon:yes gene_type:complete